jgi:ketosteroid isomerase-like protein
MNKVFEVGERFFSAIEAGDMDAVRDVYHPDVAVWHNSDGLENRERGQSREDNVALLTVLTKKIKDWKYDIWFREATESGMVQQHTLRGRLPNGDALAIPVCIVLQIQDGCITRLDEYIDSAHTQPMVDALRA